MEKLKKYLVSLIVIMGGMIFLSSTTCIRYVDRKITVVNESERTIYTMLKCYVIPENSATPSEYEIPHHPSEAQWVAELAPGESFQGKWSIEEDFRGEEIVFKVFVIYEDNYQSNSLSFITEHELYDEVIVRKATEIEADGFRIVYRDNNLSVE